MDPLSIVMALAQFAPSLIKWATGSSKAESVANIALEVAGQVTGAKATPEILASLKANAEMAAQFADKVAQREQDLALAYLDDVASARGMQTAALQQDDLFSKRFVYYFAMAWSAFAMVFFLIVTLCAIAPGGQRFADTILGFLLGTAVASIFQFFYGTTSRSQKKDETIKQLSAGR